MKVPLLLFFATIPFALFCQNYEPLKAEGTIPSEFVTKSSEKYLKEKQNLAKTTEEKKSQKVKSAFYMESTFSMDNLLRSGYVLFNDPVSVYVNKVAAEILTANPDITTDIRFYTLKSTDVNAFSTNDGIVMINLGLIAQLENEAQLAFILCHEISHVLEKHAIQNYIHVEEVSKGKGVYKKLSFDEKMVAHMRYSKENEEEADQNGFELYANTKYAFDALDGVFDVLQYAHLPIDNVPFNYSLLESANLIFPEEYKLTEVNSINTEEEEDDDDKSTHPSIPIRRQYIADAIKGKSTENRKRFISSEAEFKKAQTLARNELMRLYINNRDYETAIYHGSLLLGKDTTERQFIEEAIGRALYGLAFYKAEDNFIEVHLKAKETEGYLHQTTHLFESMKKDEIVIVALRYLLALESKYPDNPSNGYYVERLIKLIVQELDIKWDYFLSETLADAKKKAEETEAEDSVAENKESQSKYDKIKNQSVAEAPKTNFIRYALADYKSDPGIKKLFTKYKKEDDEEKALTSKQKKAIERRGYSLNIDKVLVFDPIYAFIDERKKESYRYLESEKGQENLSGRIEDISEKLGLQIALLDAGKISTEGIAEFNDFAFLTEYINERLRHPDDLDISTIERDRVLEFTKKYGTNYVNLNALVYLKQRPQRLFAVALTYTIIFPFVLPFTLPAMISSGKNCYFLSLLYNLETDKLEFSEGYNIYASDQKYLVNSHLYHTLHQIKSAKK